MNRHTVRMLLREVAVLVTALALLVAGNLVTREHLLARAGLGGQSVAICHGDPDAAPAGANLPDAQRNSHLCDQCVACQATLATLALPILGQRAGWHIAQAANAVPQRHAATRLDLPPATGPPHLG